MFEEISAYEYRENRKARSSAGSSSSSEPHQTGIRPGFEEDFSFGDDDDSDYSDRPDVKEIWPFE